MNEYKSEFGSLVIVFLVLVFFVVAVSAGADCRVNDFVHIHANAYNRNLVCRHASALVVNKARSCGLDAELVVIHRSPMYEDHAVPVVRLSGKWCVIDRWHTGQSNWSRVWYADELPLQPQWYMNRLFGTISPTSSITWRMRGVNRISTASDFQITSALAEAEIWLSHRRSWRGARYRAEKRAARRNGNLK